MKFTALAVLLVTVLAVPASAYDWAVSPINGHRYILVDCSSWSNAEGQAIALGGHLATIRSEAENDWVYQFALDSKADCYRLWLGLCQSTDPPGPAPGYAWSWISGEPVTFTKWASWDDPARVWVPNDHGFMFTSYYNHNYADEELTFWAPERDTGAQYVMTTGIVEVIPIPEPSSIFSLIAGLATLTTLKWRKKR